MERCGGSLSQVKNGQERVIAYSSHVPILAQIRYCTTQKELLPRLMRFKAMQGQLARFLEELSLCDFQILHRKLKDHINCDLPNIIPN